MTKNSGGGNKQKRQGRKFLLSNTTTKLRESEDASELYAIVVKMSGGENCIVKCIDQTDRGQVATERTCVIRKKFRGRHRRHNKLESGTWCLIGLRDWESKQDDKKEKCDLLEVYNDQDKLKLIQKNADAHFKLFNSMDNGHNDYIDSTSSAIKLDLDSEQEDNIASGNGNDVEFNFDDI
jgi:hypothetical protein